MKCFATSIGAIFLLSGCATSTQWAHPDITDEAKAKDAAVIAYAQCSSFARRLAPLPTGPSYMPVPANNSYYTQGTVSTYGNTSYINTYTQSGGGFSQDFAEGYNGGAALGHAIASIALQRQQKQLIAACMRQLGWIDSNSQEGK